MRDLWESNETEQRAIVLEYDPGRMTREESTAALNEALRHGWRVVTTHPMGAVAGSSVESPRFASLVILTREIKDATV